MHDAIGIRGLSLANIEKNIILRIRHLLPFFGKVINRSLEKYGKSIKKKDMKYLICH